MPLTATFDVLSLVTKEYPVPGAKTTLMTGSNDINMKT